MSTGRAEVHAAHCQLGDKVLSSWFDDARFRAAWAPVPELFATDDQRAIATIAAARGEQLDADSLVLALERSGKLKLWQDGAQGVYDHLHAAVSLDPWSDLDALKRAAGAYQLRKRLEEALLDIDRGEDFDAVRGRVGEAARAADEASGGTLRTVREIVGAAYERATTPNRQPGQRTLARRLDDITGGLGGSGESTVWLLAAGTSWGKSSAVVAMADQLLADGRRPMIVSFEDAENVYGRRLITLRSRINAMRLRDGKLNDVEHPLLAHTYASSEEVPCFLNAVGRPVEAVCADIRSAVKSDGITHVFVDYIQRARCATKQQDRRLDIFFAGCLLTDTIKAENASGVLASQLTEDEKTGKSKARDCEDLHNNAEVLIFGRKDMETGIDASGHKTRSVAKRWLWVQKVKEGPAELRVDLEWDHGAACFVSDYSSPNYELEFPY